MVGLYGEDESTTTDKTSKELPTLHAIIQKLANKLNRRRYSLAKALLIGLQSITLYNLSITWQEIMQTSQKWKGTKGVHISLPRHSPRYSKHHYTSVFPGSSVMPAKKPSSSLHH